MRKILLGFLFIITLSSAAVAEEKASLKLVFPFGEGGNNSITFCPPAQQTTMHGCCDESGAVVYTYGPGQTACCKQPGSIRTEGGVTRCCAPTTDSCPTGTLYDFKSTNVCGTCCNLPKTVKTVGTKQGCCDPVSTLCPTGTLYNVSETNICGTCCASPKVVETVGANQDCCSVCTGGRNRVNQTAGNPCGTCECPKGQYYDGATCQPCAPNCLDCDNGTSCNQCAATHPIWNGAFCTGCPVCP